MKYWRVCWAQTQMEINEVDTQQTTQDLTRKSLAIIADGLVANSSARNCDRIRVQAARTIKNDEKAAPD